MVVLRRDFVTSWLAAGCPPPPNHGVGMDLST